MPDAIHALARHVAGTTLAGVTVRMRMAGPPGAPVVLVLGGISADRQAVFSADEGGEGWWQGALGADGADLLSRHRVLGLDYLGGPGGTEPERNRFRPAALDAVSTTDQARLIERLLAELGLERVTVIGASYGGMVALQLATLCPDRLDRCLVLAAAHQPEPMAVARRWVQKKLLELQDRPEAGAHAVSVARALAITTYRSPREFRQRFGGPDGARSLVSYLEHQGDKFAARFGREDYRLLLDSIDNHAVDPARVTTPLTLVGFDTDELCPPALLRELATRVPRLKAWHRLQSIYGHDAFLCEKTAVAGLVTRFLEEN